MNLTYFRFMGTFSEKTKIKSHEFIESVALIQITYPPVWQKFTTMFHIFSSNVAIKLSKRNNCTNESSNIKTFWQFLFKSYLKDLNN